MAIVYAGLFAPPAPPRTWIGLQMTWTGWDGSGWSLSDAADGTVMMAGVRGLTMPPVVHYTTQYPSVAGARWRGHTVEPREIFWPIQVFSDTSSQGWIDRERAFWRTMRPEKTGTWTVIQPSGEERKLDCRFVDDSNQAFNQDPVLAGWSNYGITMKAEQPFWRAEPIRREWKSSGGAAVPFFPAAPGDGFRISSSTTSDGAKMLNPGDVDAYPRWEIHGPVTSAVVGVGGKNIEVPFAVADGKVLVIETDPTMQTATEYTKSGLDLISPTDKTASLGAANFVPLPADSTATVSLTIVGSGKVALILTPLYLRAW